MSTPTAPAAAKPPSPWPVLLAWAVAILSLGYMLPWAIAETGRRENRGGVALVNLLTGWTVIGWIIALVMAVQPERPPTIVLSTVPAGWYPDPQGQAERRYWDGARWTEHTT